MKKARYRVVILAAWLMLFYSMERLLAPIGLTNVAYTVVLLLAVLTLIAPPLARGPLWVSLVIPVPIFLALKAWSNTDAVDLAVPVTLIEICAIAITVILARWASLALNEMEEALARLIIGPVDQTTHSVAEGYESIYREVRRARNHQRPLAVMAVAPDKDSMTIALDRIVQEAQLAVMKQYTLSGVSRVLLEGLDDSNVVAQDKDHFLIVVPEVAPEQLTGLTERLRRLVSEKVGVAVSFGTACLPQDGLTFEGLKDKAVADMELDLSRRRLAQPKRLSVEGSTTQP